ncbi:MAG TPA: hypothetical protein VII00_00185 [bacterium]
MKIIKWIILVVVGVAVILLFGANMEQLMKTTKFTFPFVKYETYNMPMFVFFAFFLITGYVAGWLQFAIRNFFLRRELSNKGTEIEKLKRDKEITVAAQTNETVEKDDDIRNS